ncbi:MAG: iron ABC transporter permease [Omnitrophica WOR_2 bacterium RIFCSPLOWO2_12_FULL_46_30]|nr:MAG: iron ABC transporter permease [Omnitrophica WOR_2 bacterium RIFCSPLOWO2_12_FULL_46_30]
MKSNKKITRWCIYLFVLGIILLGISLLSLCVGSAAIPVRKIISLLSKASDSAEYSILFNIRLPRIIMGFAVGGALSISGVILQGMFRNPLVEPYTLGISGGAALGVVLSIIAGLSRRLGGISLPVSGFLGAILVIILVFYLSIRKRVLRIQGLLLYGVMISFVSSSLIMLLMAISGADELRGIVFWIMGSLEQPNWLLIKTAVWVSISGLIIAYFFSLQLNALSLGEEDARALGINVENTKKVLFLLTSVLTGMSVSICGIIGFVGLIVPHFIRLLVGNDQRILLGASFLCGSSFLILSDTLARTIIAPTELPVGVITGIIGGSVFIFALTKFK